MKRIRRTYLFVLILAALSPSRPLESAQSLQTAIAPTADEWLSGADRRDIPWHVRVHPPMLTYQQRYLVMISGYVYISDLRKNEVRSFTLQVKVQDASGKWLPGEDSADFEVPLDPSSVEAAFHSAVYALPGDYRFAITLFDQAHRRVNLWHKAVHVPDVKGNVLPDLTRGLPAIEFPSRIPGMEKGHSLVKDRGWSLAEGSEKLPIKTTHPLLIDVLLDFSEPDALPLVSDLSSADRGWVAQAAYYRNIRLMLQPGSVLSHLQPTDGCVRVSAVDTSRMRVILDRRAANELNWKEFEDSLYAVDLDRIDLGTLSSQQRRSLFAARYLTELAADTASCKDRSGKPEHVVVLVSLHLQYPRHTPVTAIQPADCPLCRFIYLELTYAGDVHEDRYRDLLKLLQPCLFRVTSPEDFRKVLAKLTTRLADFDKACAHDK